MRLGRPLRITLALLLALLAALYLGAGWYFSNVLIDFPTYSLDEDSERLGVTPADVGLPEPEAFEVQTGAVTLTGWYVANRADCGVLLLHGHASTRYGALDYAPLFWERGCHLVMYDARAHGSSSGKFGTYGALERRDAQAVLAYFMARSGLARSQIGLLGESYGGATALLTAALEPGLAFVAADSSYRSLRGIVAERAVAQYGAFVRPFVPVALLLSELRAGFDVDDAAPIRVMADIDAPIFLQHSQQDSYTLPHHSADLYAAMVPGRGVLELTDWGAAHAQAVNVDFAAYKALMDAFLARYVPQFPEAASTPPTASQPAATQPAAPLPLRR